MNKATTDEKINAILDLQIAQAEALSKMLRHDGRDCLLDINASIVGEIANAAIVRYAGLDDDDVPLCYLPLVAEANA